MPVKTRTIPENLRKKQEREQRVAKEAEERKVKEQQKAESIQKYALEQGKNLWNKYLTHQQEEVNKRREAFSNDQFYVADAPKYFLVIRIKGIRKVPPKEKKILRLFRLIQIGNAIFIKNNKATMNMLRRIEPYVTYGAPSRSTIKKLVYKRGHVRVNGQRIPICSNEVIESGLGKYGVKCVEDLIDHIFFFGENFKEVVNYLWVFKLNAPKGGFRKKRQPYLNGGSHGPREEFINELVNRML